MPEPETTACGMAGMTIGRFEQTEPGRVHIHYREERDPNSATVNITQPGWLIEPWTGKRRSVRRTFRAGAIRRAGTGWEPDEELSRYLAGVRGSPAPTRWPNPERAAMNIEAIMFRAWQRSQEESQGESKEEPPPA